MSRIFGLEASYIFTLNYQMWFSSGNRQELFIEIKFSHIFSGVFWHILLPCITWMQKFKRISLTLFRVICFWWMEQISLIALIFFFPVRVMWQYFRELFLSNFVLFSCISTHNLWNELNRLYLVCFQCFPNEWINVPREPKGQPTVDQTLSSLFHHPCQT